MRSKNNKSLFIYALSFLIPVLIAAFAYLQQGIYPGGPNTVLIYDLRAESLSLYGYLSHLGPGYDNLFHWMSGGLGGGFIGSAAMYLSVFDIIFFFIPIPLIPTAIYFLLLIKIGLCGLFFSVFISHVFGEKLPAYSVILLSCCYALMSYVLTYSILLIWLDGVMLLPLLALLAEKITEGKKSAAFALLLSVCMIDDYYIAFMISITLVLYVVFRLIEKGTGIKDSIRRIASFVVHGLISAGMASVILIPVAFDLTRGKFSENVGLNDGLMIKNGITEVFKMMLPSNYSNLGSNQPPYIFCGSVVLILSFIWLLAGRKNAKSRIAAVGVVLIYFASFIFGPLDRVWHGFRDPIGFSCRYSFTFVFFMVCFAARGIEQIRNADVKISSSLKKLIPVIVFIYTVFELSINSSYLISKLMEDYTYSDSEGYEFICEVVNTSLEAVDNDASSQYGRIVKNYNFSSNDGALFGYDGIDMFTSSYNSSLISFLRSLGINASVNFIRESGMTPPLADILSVRNFLSYWYDVSDYYTPLAFFDAFGIYENENSLPFAYRVSYDGTETRAFTNNPFENINTVYSDVFGTDTDTAVFDLCSFEYTSGADDPYTSIIVSPKESGHYWIYPEFVYVPVENDGSDYMPSDLVYLTYYVDGNQAGNCGFYNFRYCGDLGYLEEGREYSVAFDSPSSVVGNIHIAYYDHELCSELVSGAKGLELSDIGSKGIRLSGDMESSSYVLITLPHDSGYRVKVNGEKITPSSYRNAFMLIYLDSGYNDIEIRYNPDGLIIGVIVTVISVILCVLFTYRKSNAKKKD